jgi:hypothetical protein
MTTAREEGSGWLEEEWTDEEEAREVIVCPSVESRWKEGKELREEKQEKRWGKRSAFDSVSFGSKQQRAATGQLE